MDSFVKAAVDHEMLKSQFGQSMKVGPVTHVDAKKGYRIRLGDDGEGGDFLSPWIPHPETSKTSVPLKVGQMVGIMAPSGDLRQGLLIRGGYSKDHETPNEDMNANVFKDAGVEGRIADGKLLVTVGGVTVSISADGFKVVGGKVEHNDKDIGDTHKHGKVTPGPSPTDVPV